ncbi:MAG TPA: hypothetical protein ENN40_07105 [Candidatus Aminicenantes bacterium]|jgi:hypothetical protein|nr:hypothetical protein [Candidatus Aminicenantes bacterium]
MKSTLDPDVIYTAFDRNGLPVHRIDNFDRGDFAEIRAELNYPGFLTVPQLQEITLKLNLIEQNENLRIEIVHIDMIHHSIRVNIHIRK